MTPEIDSVYFLISALAGLLASALWPALLAFVYLRNEPQLRLMLDAYVTRLIPPVPPPPIEVPDDLLAIAASSFQDAWAQEDMVKSMRERYEALGSWDLVRVAYGVAGRGDGT